MDIVNAPLDAARTTAGRIRSLISSGADDIVLGDGVCGRS